ncbi:MAG TPA: glycosyltransferase [Sphingomonas sp.]|nr:glycosyltransferase [Sphingomonas sp.]
MNALRKFAPSDPVGDSDIEVTIVMPCAENADTLAARIKKAVRFLLDNHLSGEVLIVGDGSFGAARPIAIALGARIVAVPDKGYGAALMGGIAAARGCYVIVADAEDGFEPERMMPFVKVLRAGADLVVANRFRGGMGSGVQSQLRRRPSHPVLSFVGQLFYATPIGDSRWGLRGCRKDAVARLHLTAPEFARDLIAKAASAGLDVRKVPATRKRDERSRARHVRYREVKGGLCSISAAAEA